MYKHTQSGTITRIAAVAGLAVTVFAVSQVGSRPILWLVGFIGVVGMFALSSMTVEIDHERLRFWFGPGWIGRSFPLREIRSWTPVTNPWWYGWGIRLTPHGWLYNVSGWEAIEITMRNGRRFCLGTDEPGRLREAIREASV